MYKYVKFLIGSIKRKGLIESLINGLNHLLSKLFSILKILFLKIRGYRISYSVLLRGNNFFFQSTKYAISISDNSTIGKGTRISGGGDGRVFIGKNVLIDDHTFIMAHEKIEIGDDTKIAAFCFVTDFNHRFQERDIPISKQGYDTKPVIIGKNVWIGTHSIVLPGVLIGDGAVIGAGSVVTKNIPSDSVAVGSPARVIKRILKK